MQYREDVRCQEVGLDNTLVMLTYQEDNGDVKRQKYGLEYTLIMLLGKEVVIKAH